MIEFKPCVVGNRFHGVHIAEEQHRVDKQAVLQKKQVFS